MLILIICACAGMIFFLPQAKNGAKILCNCLFEESEAVNTYIYQKFSVEMEDAGNAYPGSGESLCIVLLIIAGCSLMVILIISKSRILALALAAAVSFFQIYFGLSFPLWINILVFSFFGIIMMGRFVPGRIAAFCVMAGIVTAVVMIAAPGRNEQIEEASEYVRDILSDMSSQNEELIQELPKEWMAMQHANMRSLQAGSNSSQNDVEYDIINRTKEQISKPDWINYLKIVVFLLLAVLLVSAPVIFILLKTRRDKKIICSPDELHLKNINQDICGIFRQVTHLLENKGHCPGNYLYMDWDSFLEKKLGTEYAGEFKACAAIFEEAMYSDHEMKEEDRGKVLALLADTKTRLGI